MTIRHLFILTAVCLLTIGRIDAQTILSNLDQSPDNPIEDLDASVSMAQSFFVGDDAGSYNLNMLSLSLGDSFEPHGLTWQLQISIYSDANNIPDSVIAGGLLNASVPSPVSAGVYTYSPNADMPVVLNANTTYWIVAACVQSGSDPFESSEGFNWQSTQSGEFTSDANWTISSTHTWATILVGVTGWSSFNGDPFLFSISATPVPEPSTWGLIGAGMAVVLYRLKKRTA